MKKHPLFFVGCGRKPAKVFADSSEELDNQPKDILAETERVFQTVPNDSMPIQVLALQKTYPGIDGNPPKRAIKKVTFGVDDCSSFGILGHNGIEKKSLKSDNIRGWKNDSNPHVNWTFPLQQWKCLHKWKELVK